MRLIVTDANIIIDMAAGGLLADMFRLTSVEFAIPNILYVEELAAQYGQLPGLGLKVLPLSSEAIGAAIELRTKYKKPSQNDLFALVLAKEENAPLLSGDGDLRDAAQTEHVEIHGTVWLIELMLKELKIDIDRVEKAYDLMRADGSRLPWDEVKKQIKRWKAKH